MTVIDVDALLAEVSEDAPCGEDLEYDPVFLEMERASQGTGEQEMGDAVIEAEPPDWRSLKAKAMEVLERSKDIRAGVYLARALINTDGFPGLHDGLAVVSGLLEKYWQNLHPELDPDDDYDPLMRVNILESLADRESTLNAVREAPLVSSRVLGIFGLREFEIAEGIDTLPADWEGQEPTLALIEGAFTEIDLDELQATATAVDDSVTLLETMDATLAGVMDISATPSFAGLSDMLKEIQKRLNEQLVRRGVGVEAEGEEGLDGEGGGGDGATQRISGEIGSRDDVTRTLDKIIDYYRRHEPSSPVPILLERAKTLVSMDFMEIVQNLSPSGVTEIETLRGPVAEPEAEEW